MSTRPAPDARRIILQKHLELALTEAKEPETRFHIRQALQMTV